MVLKMLCDIEGFECNFFCFYFMCVKGGVLMKLIIVVICNGENWVIGLFCINVNFDVFFL